MKAVLNLPLSFWIAYPLAAFAWVALVDLSVSAQWLPREPPLGVYHLPSTLAWFYLYLHHKRNRPETSRFPRARAFGMAWASLLSAQLLMLAALVPVGFALGYLGWLGPLE